MYQWELCIYVYTLLHRVIEHHCNPKPEYSKSIAIFRRENIVLSKWKLIRASLAVSCRVLQNITYKYYIRTLTDAFSIAPEEIIFLNPNVLEMF